MSISVEAHYKEIWNDSVTLRFQSRGHQLSSYVMPPVRFEGNKIYFLRDGELVDAEWGGKGHDVVAQEGAEDKLEMTSKEWDVSYYLYDIDKWKGAPAEEQRRQRQAGNSMGRRQDRIIYDKVMAASIPAGNIIGDYSAGLTPYMLKQGEAILFDNYTPTDGRTCLPIPATQFQRLTTYQIFQKSDWAGVTDNPRIKASQGRTFGELDCFQLERATWLPYVSGSQLRVRAWHKECVGYGHVAPEQMRHEWERQATKKRWQVMHTLDGGALVVEPNGIVEFRLKADALIEQEVLRTQAVT